jgi:hypothetical protein
VALGGFPAVSDAYIQRPVLTARKAMKNQKFTEIFSSWKTPRGVDYTIFRLNWGKNARNETKMRPGRRGLARSGVPSGPDSAILRARALPVFFAAGHRS